MPELKLSRAERICSMDQHRKHLRDLLYTDVYALVMVNHKSMDPRDRKRVLMLVNHKLDELSAAGQK